MKRITQFERFCSLTFIISIEVIHMTTRSDVTSKVGDHVRIDEASSFFLFNFCQHQNKKNVMSTIMKTMIFSSFLCIFAKY